MSGPNSLESLRTSFLGDYLPADPGATQAVSAEQLAVLNTSWSVPSKNRQIDTTLSIKGDVPLEALKLELRPNSQFVPGTADLVAERRVGRGRVALSAFSLARREITNWRSFDNFFNACLLRRPPRRYVTSDAMGLSSQWSDSVVRALMRRPASSSDSFSADEADPTLDIEKRIRRQWTAIAKRILDYQPIALLFARCLRSFASRCGRTGRGSRVGHRRLQVRRSRGSRRLE